MVENVITILYSLHITLGVSISCCAPDHALQVRLSVLPAIRVGASAAY